MISIMQAIYQQVDGSHEHATYNARAPQKIKDENGNDIPTPYPYVVYKMLPIDNTEQDRDDFTLEVSCWDKSESTSHSTVLDIAEKVRKALERYRETNTDNLLFVSRPSVGYVPDPDAMIKRYDVTTTLMTYRRD